MKWSRLFAAATWFPILSSCAVAVDPVETRLSTLSACLDVQRLCVDHRCMCMVLCFDSAPVSSLSVPGALSLPCSPTGFSLFSDDPPSSISSLHTFPSCSFLFLHVSSLFAFFILVHSFFLVLLLIAWLRLSHRAPSPPFLCSGSHPSWRKALCLRLASPSLASFSFSSFAHSFSLHVIVSVWFIDSFPEMFASICGQELSEAKGRKKWGKETAGYWFCYSFLFFVFLRPVYLGSWKEEERKRERGRKRWRTELRDEEGNKMEGNSEGGEGETNEEENKRKARRRIWEREGKERDRKGMERKEGEGNGIGMKQKGK